MKRHETNLDAVELGRIVAAGLYEKWPQCFNEFRVSVREIEEEIAAILERQTRVSGELSK